jgi:hypothetical protein
MIITIHLQKLENIMSRKKEQINKQIKKKQ